MNPVDPKRAMVDASRTHDSVGNGVLWALPWQFGAVVLSMPLLFTCWGLIQWIALIPLYISRRRKGYPLMAKGLLFAGFVGVLVNEGSRVIFLHAFIDFALLCVP